MTDNNKPNLVNYGENEWEFVYPPNIDNESVYNEFWEGVEQLNYNDKIAEKIFKLLIKKHPFYLDAYNHLSIAFRNQNKTFESFITAEKAYNLGKSIFPKEFDKDKDELIWSNHDNRPFLRCCQTFGQEYQLQNKYKKAIEIYSEILHYNNGDNQGIRYLILECHFALKDYKQAEIFISKYENDWSIEFLFGKLVIEILKENKNIETLIDNALKVNKFLPQEILKTKHIAPPPFRIKGEPNFNAGIPNGSIQEAYEHWKRNKVLYRNKKIIEFFRERKNTSA